MFRQALILTIVSIALTQAQPSREGPPKGDPDCDEPALSCASVEMGSSNVDERCRAYNHYFKCLDELPDKCTDIKRQVKVLKASLNTECPAVPL